MQRREDCRRANTSGVVARVVGNRPNVRLISHVRCIQKRHDNLQWRSVACNRDKSACYILFHNFKANPPKAALLIQKLLLLWPLWMGKAIMMMVLTIVQIFCVIMLSDGT